MWSSDYPHPVSSWPKSQMTVDGLFDGMDAADRHAMVCGNAERIWGL